MRLRLQRLDEERGRRARYVLGVQDRSGGWDFSLITESGLDCFLERAGMDDFRDRYEVRQQARAAVRALGLGTGLVEWEPSGGTSRRAGDLLSEASPPPCSPGIDASLRAAMRRATKEVRVQLDAAALLPPQESGDLEWSIADAAGRRTFLVEVVVIAELPAAVLTEVRCTANRGLL